MEFIAIDIGSGLTKFMKGSQKSFFPSAVGESKDHSGFSMGINEHEDIFYNGKKYLTGTSALGTLAPKDITNSTCKDWCKDTKQLILVMSVIAKLFPEGYDGELGLALGIPIAMFKSEHENYKKIFVGSHHFNTPKAEYKVMIHDSKVDVLPQVLGLHFRNVAFGGSSQDFAYGKFSYIDPGTQTTGFAVIDSNVFSKHLSDGEEKGMFHLAQKMEKILMNTYGYSPGSKYEILKGFRLGKMTIYNEGKQETIDMLKLSQAPAAEVFGGLLDKLSQLWNRAGDMPVYVSSGGGRYLLSEVKKRFPHAILLSSKHSTNKKKPGKDVTSQYERELRNVAEGSDDIFHVVEGFYTRYLSQSLTDES